ncbi:MAG: T9SS type A sorting domain-containing protein [Bacteroidia bacterium]
MKYFFYTLLSLLLLQSSLFAQTEYLGGVITWECAGNDSFLVSATIYTRCGLNYTISTDLEVTDSLGTNSIGLTLVSEEEVTNVCDSVSTRCDTSGAAFPYSIKKRVLTVMVDAGNYSGCNLRFSYTACCRNSLPYSPGFYIESSFNRCLASCSNSPKFSFEPLGIMCEGDCQYYPPGVTYSIGDSLDYSLTPPLSSNGSPISYASPYSDLYPIYFNGFPNANLPFNPPLCRGFHLDASTGNLYFRPMQAQRSQMAVKVDIYKNGIKTGEITRDMHLTIMNCPSNDNPVISGINGGNSVHINACPGINLSFTINSSDGDSTDTLTMTWNEGIPGSSFTLSSGRIPTGTFSWTPTESDIRTEPYTFTVKLQDDGCPVSATIFKTFYIRVVPFVHIDYSVTNNGCGSYTFQIDSIFPGGTNIEWSGQGGIGEGNGGQDARSYQFTHQFLQGGTYPFQIKGRTDCSPVSHDTLVVDPIINVELPADTLLYRGDSMLLTPVVQAGIGPLQYLWLPDSSTSNSLYASPDSSGYIILAVTDSLGCTWQDTIYIEVWDVPSPTWITYTDSCGALRFMLDSNHIHPSTELAWRFNDTILGSEATLMAEVPVNGSYPVELRITSLLSADTFHYRDTIVVTEIASVEITAPGSVCANSHNVISALPQGGSAPYTFTWSLSDSAYNADSVEYAIVHDTTVHVYFSNAEGCSARDTVRITTYPVAFLSCPSSFDICLNEIKNLKNTCNLNGTWQGPGVVDSMFYPAVADTGTHLLHFVHTDAFQCIYTDSVEVTVKPLPALTMSNLQPLCINADSISLFSFGRPLSGTWRGTGVLAPFHFHPKIAGTGSHPLVYTYRGSNGCYNSDTIVANVNALPIVNAGSDFSICLNESRNMGGQPAGGTWNGPGIVGGNTLNGALAGVGNHPLIYHYTDSNGCASRDTVIAEVKTLPTVDAGANFSVCQSGASISLGGTPTGGTWRGIGVSNNEFDPSLAVTGTHPLIYEYELGCKNTDTLLVTVTAPVVDTGPDTELCLTDEPIAFFATPTGGTWSGTGIQNDSFYASIAGIGTFTINYSFTDTGQCAASNTMDVTVHPLPDFTPDYQVINPPTEVRFSLITGDTLSNYLWNFGDGSTSILASPVHNYPQGDTTYNAYITAQNQFQCIDTAYFEVVLDLTGIAEAAAQGFRIFPNPVSESLNIVVQEAWNNGRIQLLDLQGKVLYQQAQIKLAPGETLSIDMQGLAAGTYLLQLVNADGVHIVRVVK